MKNEKLSVSRKWNSFFPLLFSLFPVALSITGCAGGGSENLIVYPWPEGMEKYTDITMTANKKNIDLYSVRANNTYGWRENPEAVCDQIPVAMFDMNGTVAIEVTLPVDATDVIVRPLSSNIQTNVNGKKISFSITQPGQYSVEYNNNPNRPQNALLIFANPIETFTGDIVVEPGLHETGYRVESGQTLYLKAGAVIRGRVVLGSNSKIVGRGIIDGSHLKNWLLMNNNFYLPISTNNTENLVIDGITIFDSNAWNIELRDTSNVMINNLKIVSSRCNSDGISIQSSNDITIQNSFIRTWDDSIVVKVYGKRDSYNITARNCRIWTDLAQSLEIGFETNKGRKPDPKIYNITFEDIDIFHAMHKAPISIHNGDNTEIFDVVYRNITIENYQAGSGDGWNFVIDLTNLTGAETGGSSSWTTVTERGSIHDILIENVKIVSGKTPLARLRGSPLGGSIYNVTVKDIYHGTTKLDLGGYVFGPNVSIAFK